MTEDEFYIGWEATAPPRTGRFVRTVVTGLAFLVVGLGAVLAVRQADFPAARFEFAIERELRGVLRDVPALRLVVTQPDSVAGDYLLVGEGKHGAHAVAARFHGRTATVGGSLILRDRHRMLEVHEIEADVSADLPAPPEPLGGVTLVGVIADGKCWLGVMNPGEGKVHRACAARCISGGAPPVLVVTDSTGRATPYLLTGQHGVDLDPQRLLSFVAEPVRVTGQLMRDGEWLFLRIDIEDIVRL